MRLFVYATLKDHLVRRQAIGRDVAAEPAKLGGWTPVNVAIDGERWPNLVAHDHAMVTGDLIDVDDVDWARLDQWESRYIRLKLQAEDGEPVWAYVLRGHR